MLYSIIEFFGLQYWVETGFKLTFINFSWYSFYNLFFTKLLLVRLFNSIFIGRPFIINSIIKIFGINVKKKLNTKIIIYKMNAKKHYRKKLGYRQVGLTVDPFFLFI